MDHEYFTEIGLNVKAFGYGKQTRRVHAVTSQLAQLGL